MLLMFLVFYRNRKPYASNEQGADADQSVNATVFYISQTDVISETKMFSLTVSETFSTYDEFSSPLFTKSTHLTRVLTNVLIRKYEEIAANQGTPTSSPTPSIPKYFSPPLLVGISFTIVFVVGLIYTNCFNRTVIINTPKDNNDDDDENSDDSLDDFDSNPNQSAKKKKRKGKDSKKTKKV